MSAFAVSRITTRAKIAVCVALLAAAAGVMVVSSSKPEVTLRFVQFTNGGALLEITNRGTAPVFCLARDVDLITGRSHTLSIGEQGYPG